MKKYIVSILYCFVMLLFSCSQKKSPDITFYQSGELKCKTQRKPNSEEFFKTCYYKEGMKKEISSWRNDTTKVNEYFHFYENGQLNEYSFYDMGGNLRYSRFYDEGGLLLKSRGDFVSHNVISSHTPSPADTVTIEIYIASPPKSSHKVYGFDSNGRYSLENKSEVNYIFKTTLKPMKEGKYTFSYEVDFFDSLTNKTETHNSVVKFEVQ